MAKKGKGRRRGKRLIVGRYDHSLDVSSLAVDALVSSSIAAAVEERSYVISMDVVASIGGGASGQTLVIGVAHGDYTNAEIEEWYENSGSWDEGSLPDQEKSRRKCRQIGMFSSSADQRIEQGENIRVKLGWILNQGEQLTFWGYNTGTTSMSSTTFVTFVGQVYLRPT